MITDISFTWLQSKDHVEQDTALSKSGWYSTNSQYTQVPDAVQNLWEPKRPEARAALAAGLPANAASRRGWACGCTHAESVVI